LEYLYIQKNQLTGSIPSGIGNLTNLVKFHANANQFTGSIPVQIGNLVNLQTLYLGVNQFTGGIPAEIGNLTNLIELSLRECGLTGSIPPQIGNLTNLIYLGLYKNQLTGSLPAEIGNLNNLTGLVLYTNDLSGCYDPNLLNLCGQAESGDITYNNNFDASWEDFCLDGTGGCDGTSPDPVWPGDFNSDGIVNTDDALYWGIASGFTGATRPGASFVWSAQDCQDWALSVNGINSKHQDGDGDGTVNDNDLNTIVQNYGNTHDYAPLAYATEAIQYRLELISSVPNGNTIINTYELYAESPSDLPTSTHGLACSIDFDDMPVNSAIVNVSNSSLMPHKHLDIFLTAQNRLDLALTRTDQNNQALISSIASIVVDMEDVQVGDPFEIHIGNGSMMSADGSLTAIGNATFYGAFTGGPTIISNLSVNVSANHEGCNTLGSATAQVTGGAVPYTYAWSTGANAAQVSNLASGSYTVTVSDANGLSTTVPVQINQAVSHPMASTKQALSWIQMQSYPQVMMYNSKPDKPSNWIKALQCNQERIFRERLKIVIKCNASF